MKEKNEKKLTKPEERIKKITQRLDHSVPDTAKNELPKNVKE